MTTAAALPPAEARPRASSGSDRRHLAGVLGVAILALVADAIAVWLSGSLALVRLRRGRATPGRCR